MSVNEPTGTLLAGPAVPPLRADAVELVLIGAADRRARRMLLLGLGLCAAVTAGAAAQRIRLR